MNTLISFLYTLFIGGIFFMTATSRADAESSFYDLKVPNIDGATVDLGVYRGSVTLIVNTASRCGFTSQYKSLEEIYQKYRSRGFVVLGFPSNDFMKQEPGENQDIKQFCELNYGVTFPLFAKNSVSGEKKQEAYRFLTERSAEDFRGDPGWNFVKFLVDKRGYVIGRYSSMTKPDNKDLVKDIEAALGNS